ncbi:hypothetical protein VTN00DRAFT_8449 [Thermoascus crustaceus]|uniref:uncharacterized protein n=1 Tax=Thermoascus crustaceus TaxID=5088 RepID=UPI003743BD47
MGNQILSHLSKVPATARVHFYASSGGNAGLAAVCAARSLGYPCTVVVPLSTKPLMVQKLREAGASDVIRHGENFAEAGEYMREAVMKGKTDEDDEVLKIALHPFDHEAIWEGNSTIVDELAYQLPPADNPDGDDRALPVDAMICSVGGGGLLNGLVMGIERQRQIAAKKSASTSNRTSSIPPPPPKDKPQKDTIHLLATETTGTASLALAISQKCLVSLPRITSQATSLGAVRVSSRTLQYALSPPPGVAVHSVVLDDADAARGVLRLVDDERTLVELACGVCVQVAVGDGGVSSDKRGNKKRKRSFGDEGYGTGTENESDASLSSASSDAGSADAGEVQPQPQEHEQGQEQGQFRSKLKHLVPDLTPESRVVIIICGGSNVTIEMATEWRREIERGWGRSE